MDHNFRFINILLGSSTFTVIELSISKILNHLCNRYEFNSFARGSRDYALGYETNARNFTLTISRLV